MADERPLVLNCSHLLTETQQRQLADLLDGPFQLVERQELPFFVDGRPLEDQVVELVDELAEHAGLTPGSWSSRRIALIPPSLPAACAVLLADLHGRRGGFPSVVQLVPGTEDGFTVYDVRELIDLQQLRLRSRERTRPK